MSIDQSTGPPIHSLPDDILEEIFCDLIDKSSRDEDKCQEISLEYLTKTRRRKAVYSLSNVCPRWRDVIGGIGRCWILMLSINYSRPRQENPEVEDVDSLVAQQDRWRNALSIARNCDLDITIRSQAMYLSQNLDRVAGFTHHQPVYNVFDTSCPPVAILPRHR
jgi:hypothetical protein